MNLATLQRQFAKALIYQASGETCNIVAGHFSADEQMQIYRNNVIISLSEVLEATYPILLALLGHECFTQIARQHVLNHPLKEGQVSHYGAGFAETIKCFDQVMAQAPYSCEVAHFEWELDLARQAQREQLPNTKLVPLTRLADISTDRQPDLVFHLHPGCRSIDSNYAVLDLLSAFHDQEFEQLNINQAQRGVLLIKMNGGASCHTLDTKTFQLLRCLERERPLSDIPPSLLANLSHLVQLDLIDGFTLQDYEVAK